MLVGRDTERAAIADLVNGARNSRGGALVLRGEPGVGKTALLEDACEQAPDMLVLFARGIESESDLPFATLHQLIRPSLEGLRELPRPQAAALRGALGLSGSAAEERFLVSAACLSLLSELAEPQPLLCVVDDAHWVDSASADALLFVARRLAVERIAMLYAAREGEVQAFDAPDVRSLTLSGLTVADAEELLGHVAGDTAPAVCDRLVEQARGNALALIELPSALTLAQLAGEEPLPDALPLTQQLERVFLDRVRRLPPKSQRLLLIAAADDTSDLGVVMRAAEVSGSAEVALDMAERASLVSVDRGRVEFRHPLIRSAVYGAATFGERREAHRALARALEDDEVHLDRRAWHLAASTLEPDDTIVQALDDVALRAAERGAHLAAARALARAADLTTSRMDRGQRLVRAATAARIAAADDYAVMLASQARALVDDPLERAEIACAIGAAEIRRGRPREGFQGLVDAAREVAPLDPDQAVAVLLWANSAAFEVGDAKAQAEVSKTAERIMALGRAGADSTYLLQALSAFSRALDGRSSGADELDEAFDWASMHDDAELVFVVGIALALSGDDKRFEVLNERAVSRARAQGDFGTLAQALGIRALRRAMQQRFDDALLGADESLRLARELGAVNLAGTSLFVLGYVAAIRGDDEAARQQLGEALETFVAHGLAPRAALARYALAMLDFGRGRWVDALYQLQGIVDHQDHPLLSKWALPDIVEATTRLGRRDGAGAALAAFQEWVTEDSPAWAHARAASCRGLVSRGEESASHFEEAIEIGSDERPFDGARIRLLYGEHLRRERRRAESRVQLRVALEAFERLRAEPWAERTRKELRASGETARKRDPRTIHDLTPQERQIADLVAGGLSNKEVAALLFLSPRTIDYHLRNVFVKLGITSRTQLARIGFGDGGESLASSRQPARTVGASIG
jgi:DNA-binding CsgD family transcriptional regulator/tetratricopeptide (TPR) repeat protein